MQLLYVGLHGESRGKETQVLKAKAATRIAIIVKLANSASFTLLNTQHNP